MTFSERATNILIFRQELQRAWKIYHVFFFFY